MDLKLTDLMNMQLELQEKYKDKWGGLYPAKAREQLLWSIIEAGEAADVIKKHGDSAIMSDERFRRDFIEEIGDVMMYLFDTLLCYDVTAEEFSDVYRAKFERNMRRWEKNSNE